MAATTTKTQGKTASLSRWIQGLLCGAALAWMPGYALLVGVMMLPMIAVYMMDSRRGEASARMMMPYTFAALVHPFHQLWGADGTIDASVMILMNPVTCIIGWCAAGGGWFVLELALFGVKVLRQFQVKKRKREIEKSLKALAEEWDENAVTVDEAAPVAASS
ncbi:hypothetical protein [Acetobacter conturbans]|uniref:Acyl-CoA synthetase n=1 Tax=Acetobacter conturbans TaxID=1737472 RepID=A0ABX0K189_9PROT|nr:hypothetical protein [Acetobacter conturbans]NHN88879.1 hypothetical protein [Acetobacter conturbans]